MARIQNLSAIEASASNAWVVDGVLSGMSLLWGEPGSGKSFVAIGLAAAVASERPWLGRAVHGGRVVYIAGEGGSEAVARRVRAALYSSWQVDAWDEALPLDIITPGVDLTKGVIETVELAGDIAPKLIVVDTLARCFSGDENSQEFMGAFVRSVDLLREMYDCAVLVIHHSNKQHELRGSSVLMGAVDVSWRLLRRREELGVRPYTMQADKLRERDIAGAHIDFVMEKVGCLGPDGSLEVDTLGDTLTSLVAKPSEKAIAQAHMVLDVGNAMLVGDGDTLSYAHWRDYAKLDKAEFDAALSMLLTYPGQWGGIAQIKPGVYAKVVVPHE